MNSGKTILGLDLGTNSIGWALIQHNFENKEGKILGMGSRILPMAQDVLGKFDSGQSISQTAERTGFRGVRRLLERDLLRRERLHRVLNVIGFLPEHFADEIDFEQRLGQYKDEKEPKIAYRKNSKNKFEFIFKKSFNEMVADFKVTQPQLFYTKPNGDETKIPYDWTIYYLRKKALSQKIEKEALAWILLNFNQKRGYYQLRGEDEEVEENKEKTFETLKVDKVVDSGEKIRSKDSVLYDVYFENGWKYDRQIVKTEDWLDKTKEFIVTTTTLASGEIKRSFKAVDSEQDWIAIKQKTEQEIDISNKTVGEYIYDTLLSKPNQKIRGKLVRTIERKYYKNELQKILEKQQEFHSELQSKELYNACLEELYEFNESHRNSVATRDFTYLFLDDIIFYQRPLKSKKSLISNCSYEFRTFKVDGIEKREGIKCIAKSNPLYQEFRLLQWMRNLKIYKKDDRNDIDITDELLPTIAEREKLFEWLNDKTEIDQNTFLKYSDFGLEEKIRTELGLEQFRIFKKNKEQGLHTYYRWNYVEDKKYPLNETRGEILKRLTKAGVPTDFLSSEIETQLWHILYSVENKDEIIKALNKFALKHSLPESFVDIFKKYPRINKDYGAFSEKAIKKLLKLMRFGKRWSLDAVNECIIEKAESIKERLELINYDEKRIESISDDAVQQRVLKSFLKLKNKNFIEELNTYQASYLIYDRHSETADVRYWKTAQEIELLKQHSLRNPIVEQVINEALQTVRDIWIEFGNGEENFFDEIHVELGREMKNPADKRKRLTERVTENENTNNRVKAVLTELFNEGDTNVRPYSPMQQEILKIYEEGVYGNENRANELDEIDKIRKKSQPTSSDIKRYKLWLEQGYKSPYTGSIIPLSRLFTADYQIEHIIPQSRFFDDSLSNKVICESEINTLKDNQLAYVFIKNNSGVPIELSQGKSVRLFTIEQYEENIKQYFGGNKLKSKREKLLLEKIPDSFIERQMNDTRYISRVVKSLLSNIVREENEDEGIAKNVVVSSGAITSRLKQDWGLNDVWNTIITPRFERLNQMAGYEKYGSWENKGGKRVFQINNIEPELLKLNKKRIDHRHHALDALIVACSSRNHINYLNNDNANGKDKSKPLRYDLREKLRRIEEIEINKAIDGEKTRKKIKVAREFLKPWDTFTQDTKSELQKIIVSFKKNNRVINKTVNKHQKWEKQADGSMKKVFVTQTKGDSWAIRKPLHEETVSALVELPWVKLGNNEITTATRKLLDSSFHEGKINKITDTGIQKILKNYLAYKENNPDLAFSPEGIEELNSNIEKFNDGFKHSPIIKIRVYEKGKGRFPIGYNGNKKNKYVQGAPNLFFAIYIDRNDKRTCKTIPLNIAIERQKQGLSPCEEINEKGQRLLFDLSPNDLVYVPTDEERENPNSVDFENLSGEQVKRVFNVNDFSGYTIYFTPNTFAKNIVPKELDASFDSKQSKLGSISIKDVCWKLETDRLGNIKSVKI